jgi:hypothetical protein
VGNSKSPTRFSILVNKSKTTSFYLILSNWTMKTEMKKPNLLNLQSTHFQFSSPNRIHLLITTQKQQQQPDPNSQQVRLRESRQRHQQSQSRCSFHRLQLHRVVSPRISWNCNQEQLKLKTVKLHHVRVAVKRHHPFRISSSANSITREVYCTYFKISSFIKWFC